jgi:putative aldouronate transport system permease protein
MIMTDTEKLQRRRSTLRQFKQMKMLYLFLLIPVAFTILFNYVPLYGIQIAFKDFRAADGIWDSAWNNFKHFKTLFAGGSFVRALVNTLQISILRLIIVFPAPIIFSILLNEIPGKHYKKSVQVISYLPYFMSWVVLGGIVKNILSPTRGIANYLLGLVGIAPISFLTEPSLFVPTLLLTDIWASVGWGSVIYLASMSSIDPGLYEAADIDGAGRFQKAIRITIPLLMPVIMIQLILSLGNILNGGFDQIFNLMNPKVMGVADILDTYVYRIGLEDMRYDFTTAVGLFKNVVGVVLIVIVNFITRKFSEYGVW